MLFILHTPGMCRNNVLMFRIEIWAELGVINRRRKICSWSWICRNQRNCWIAWWSGFMLHTPGMWALLRWEERLRMEFWAESGANNMWCRVGRRSSGTARTTYDLFKISCLCGWWWNAGLRMARWKRAAEKGLRHGPKISEFAVKIREKITDCTAEVCLYDDWSG